MDPETAALGVLQTLMPAVPWSIGLTVLWVVVAAPMPGRGPRPFSRRDPWRCFKFEARRAVMARAGDRCEGSVLLAWGRCRHAAVEADHIYPWSKGGATIVSNGQALCRDHNRRKSSMTPPWWYVLCLERRRRAYVPADVDVTVRAFMSSAERESRSTWAGSLVQEIPDVSRRNAPNSRSPVVDDGRKSRSAGECTR